MGTIDGGVDLWTSGLYSPDGKWRKVGKEGEKLEVEIISGWQDQGVESILIRVVGLEYDDGDPVEGWVDADAVGTDMETLSEEVIYSGILKLKPNPEIIAQAKAIMETLPHDAVPLPDKALHITLVHQGVLKKYRPLLKNLILPPDPPVILATDYEEKIDEALGRKSWVVLVENQEDLRNYVNEVMALVKGPPDPEPARVFHMTLANLTGDSGDSPR